MIPYKFRGVKFTLVTVELLVIAGLTFYLYNKAQTSVLSSKTVAPVNKQIVVCDDPELKHYCEPAPNVIWDYYAPGMTRGAGTQINWDGINSSQNYKLKKDIDTYRILALGDSHTFGVYMTNFQNYPAILENLLNADGVCNQYKNYEVINLGFWGDDPMYSNYRFQRKGKKYNPDLVIWFLKKDDFLEINDDVQTIVDSCRNSIDTTNPVETSNCVVNASKEYYSKADFEMNKKKNYKEIANFVKNYSGKILFLPTKMRVEIF